MPDSQDNSKENYGLFMFYYNKSINDLRAFLRQLLPTWHDVDEVLQETSIVLWKKFDNFEEGTNFTAWACVIARYEVLKYRRKKSRDRHIFADDILDTLASEFMEKQDQLQDKRKALKVCFNKLDKKQQQLTMASYSGDSTIKEVAEKNNRTPKAVYRALDRIRLRLQKCISSEIQSEGLT